MSSWITTPTGERFLLSDFVVFCWWCVSHQSQCFAWKAMLSISEIKPAWQRLLRKRTAGLTTGWQTYKKNDHSMSCTVSLIVSLYHCQHPYMLVANWYAPIWAGLSYDLRNYFLENHITEHAWFNQNMCEQHKYSIPQHPATFSIIPPKKSPTVLRHSPKVPPSLQKFPKKIAPMTRVGVTMDGYYRKASCLVWQSTTSNNQKGQWTRNNKWSVCLRT